jgi:hypothetical protein
LHFCEAQTFAAEGLQIDAVMFALEHVAAMSLRALILSLLAFTVCAPVALARDFSAGRPGLTESPLSVDAGRFQFESEVLGFSRSRDAGIEAWSTASLDLRYGVGPATEIEAQWRPLQRVKTKGSDTAEGGGDVTLRLRQTVYEAGDGKVALGLIPFVTLASAADNLGAARAQGGVIATGAFSVGAKTQLAVTVSAASADRADNGRRTFTGGAAFDLSYALNDMLGLYAGGATQQTAAGGAKPVNLAEAGVTLMAGKETQFDVGAVFGLTRAAPDLALSVGVARRF